MSYLSLCQKVHLLLRVGDETPGTQPAAIATPDTNTGVIAEIVSWVANAYKDIQDLHADWMFRIDYGNATVVSGSDTVTAATLLAANPTYQTLIPFVGRDFAFIFTNPIADPNAAEQLVRYLPHQQFFGHVDQAPLSTGQPQWFTVAPNGDLKFDTFADRDYNLRFPFRRQIDEFADQNANPLWQREHDDTIVYWAIVHYYCLSRDGTEQLRQKALASLNRELVRLRNFQLPSPTL